MSRRCYNAEVVDANVVDGELTRAVRTLRAEGRSPKQIARVLGVPPALVAPLVRAIAEAAAEVASASEPAILGCWVSVGWGVGLTVEEGRRWPDRSGTDPTASGLAGVMVARECARRRGVSVCGYLVDTYCLGVKNALGPRVLKPEAVRGFVDAFFSPFDGRMDAPIELARHLVWGAVEYARGLGFEPHRDFGPATGHLGPLTGPSAITFGRDGTPCFVQGPYDDPGAIMRTLTASVGANNFRFLASVPM